MSDPTAVTEDDEVPPRWVLDEPSDADFDREEGVEDCDHATDDDEGGVDAVALPDVVDADEPPDGPGPVDDEE
jgi:hypothetical protein